MRAGQAEGRADAARETLDRMIRSLSHRGPDDAGTVVLESRTATIALGHRRLAIIDPGPSGHQPMSDPRSGNWLTFNGEIYNFRELRPKIADLWRTESDAEVILRGYEKWGRELVSDLRGMFAFALWDAPRHRLFLCRDRLGIKPLYYHSEENLFLFASEVRALLASGLVPRRLDSVALWDYLSYQSIPAPRTLVSGVHSLPAGTWLTVEPEGGIEQHRYWDPLDNAVSDVNSDSEPEVRRKLLELLQESVALHMVSDVPVGAFLSGGIDSSAVVALMRDAGITPRTFSVVFSEEQFDEARYARQVAEAVGADHTELRLSDRELLDQLPEALAAMDQPTGDGINTFVIARAVRSTGLKVAQSGLGGDEIFGGYPSFRRLRGVHRAARWWGRVPTGVRRAVAGVVERVGSSAAAGKVAATLESDGTLAQLFPPTRQIFTRAQKLSLLQPSLRKSIDPDGDPYAPALARAFENHPEAGILAQVSYAEVRTYMHDVLLRDTDQMSMAHGLEVRVPLLDHRLVEYAMGLPDSLKLARRTPKRLLVESLGGRLPDEIVYRPKQGFALPLELWMRTGLRGFCEAQLTAGPLDGQATLRVDRVKALWQSFLSGGREATWSRVWVLVVLTDWLERHQVVLAE